MKLKPFIAIPVLFFSFLLSSNAHAQSCCGKKQSSEKELNTETSGCSPSNCRGAKTKFGEAKVISNLRTELIALKAELEKSENHKFSKRSYDIHGIVGESDEESIAIISKEVAIIEAEMTKKMKHDFSPIEIPSNKAQKVKYLNGRIATMKKLLES